MRLIRHVFSVLSSALLIGAYAVVVAPSAGAVTTTWDGSPAALSAATTDSYTPYVDLSADGAHAIAVFAEDDVIRAHSQSATDSDDADVSVPAEVASDPQMGVSADGAWAIVVWSQLELVPSNHDEVYASIGQVDVAGTSDAQMTWTTPELLSTDGAPATTPQIAVSADGDTAVVIWTEDSGGEEAVQFKYGRDLTSGTPAWTTEGDISDTSSSAANLDVAISATGEQATLVWSAQNSRGKSVVFGITVDNVDSGTIAFDNPPTALTSGTQDSDHPAVEMGTTSGGVNVASVVWTRLTKTGGVHVVQSASATIAAGSAAADWSTPITLSSSTLEAEDPLVALSPDGSRAMAVWRQTDGTATPVIQARLGYALDTAVPAWSATTTTLSSNASPSSSPQVAYGSAMGADSATVVWTQADPLSTYAVVQSRSAFIDRTSLAVFWNAMTVVSDVALLTDVSRPDVALSADGTDAVAVWEQNDDGTPAYDLIYGSLGQVAFDAPVNTGLPSISGKLQVGSTLKASVGRWSGATRYEIQWQQCATSTGSCSDIGGATSASYLLVSGDATKYIRVKVTASGAGSTIAYSAITRVIKAGR